ncbi:hypothetical protein RJ55_07316 [Drechmeria coniospora]|nr:hypothetical protein RJ55_07316 [Drechmeria coniospora]
MVFWSTISNLDATVHRRGCEIGSAGSGVASTAIRHEPKHATSNVGNNDDDYDDDDDDNDDDDPEPLTTRLSVKRHDTTGISHSSKLDTSKLDTSELGRTNTSKLDTWTPGRWTPGSRTPGSWTRGISTALLPFLAEEKASAFYPETDSKHGTPRALVSHRNTAIPQGRRTLSTPVHLRRRNFIDETRHMGTGR